MRREHKTQGQNSLLFPAQFRNIKLLILFMLTCLQVSARIYSQDRISIHVESVELKKVLILIEHKSDYHFLYNEALISNQPKITLNLNDADIVTVLEKLFSGTEIGYSILDNHLIALKKEN